MENLGIDPTKLRNSLINSNMESNEEKIDENNKPLSMRSKKELPEEILKSCFDLRVDEVNCIWYLSSEENGIHNVHIKDPNYTLLGFNKDYERWEKIVGCDEFPDRIKIRWVSGKFHHMYPDSYLLRFSIVENSIDEDELITEQLDKQIPYPYKEMARVKDVEWENVYELNYSAPRRISWWDESPYIEINNEGIIITHTIMPEPNINTSAIYSFLTKYDKSCDYTLIYERRYAYTCMLPKEIK